MKMSFENEGEEKKSINGEREWSFDFFFRLR